MSRLLRPRAIRCPQSLKISSAPLACSTWIGFENVCVDSRQTDSLGLVKRFLLLIPNLFLYLSPSLPQTFRFSYTLLHPFLINTKIATEPSIHPFSWILAQQPILVLSHHKVYHTGSNNNHPVIHQSLG